MLESRPGIGMGRSAVSAVELDFGTSPLQVLPFSNESHHQMYHFEVADEIDCTFGVFAHNLTTTPTYSCSGCGASSTMWDLKTHVAAQ